MSDYILTVGLEVHAELKTATKMFCNSKNDPDEERPNVNVCPVCMGHPGTLPVINREAVKHVLKVGAALGGTLADFTEFDRKNYFYPDIPKGYQISQYKYPLVSGGTLNGVAITRVHLEEDTGTSKHDVGNYSLVDYNRAGVPLMELVTEPVIRSAEEASAFAKELQLLLQYLGAGEANMEKGEMRVEANISVSKDPAKFGTKVEVKNLNSFKAVEKSIEFEMKRHIAALEKGETIIQETRGWDETKEATFSQRRKEESHDYRYFPDPDLPKLKISEISEFSQDILWEEVKDKLPWKKREAYVALGLKREDAELFTRNVAYGGLFDAVAKEHGGDSEAMKLTANYIASDVAGFVKVSPINILSWGRDNAANFAALIRLIRENKISSRGAKDILRVMLEAGGDPAMIAEEKGLFQKSDEGALKAIAEKIIAANPSVVAEYKAGKAAALQFLVGQGMKETKGSANPAILKSVLESLLA